MSERYTAPKPIFTAPKDNGLLSPQDQSHHVPSLSVVEKVKQDGWEDIADILARAKKMAQEQATVIVTAKQKSKKKNAPEVVITPPEIDPDFIVSNEEFIKRTRSGNGFNYHDPDVKKLFFANGGIDFMSNELSFVQQFENLRRHKLYALKNVTLDKTPYSRSVIIPQNVRRYVSGVPTQQKFTAIQEANIRSKNSNHYGFIQPAKKI